MKSHIALVVAVFLLLSPLSAGAQSPPPNPASGTPSSPGPSGGPGHHGGGMGMRRLFQGITLTDAQQQQIDQLTNDFRQSRQPGTPPDPTAMQTLRDNIEKVLTPDQRTQFETNLAAMQADFQKNHPGGWGGGPSPQPTSSS